MCLLHLRRRRACLRHLLRSQVEKTVLLVKRRYPFQSSGFAVVIELDAKERAIWFQLATGPAIDFVRRSAGLHMRLHLRR